jgi:hypothetical protein
MNPGGGKDPRPDLDVLQKKLSPLLGFEPRIIQLVA